jgi:hypothetical protein
MKTKTPETQNLKTNQRPDVKNTKELSLSDWLKVPLEFLLALLEFLLAWDTKYKATKNGIVKEFFD